MSIAQHIKLSEWKDLAFPLSVVVLAFFIPLIKYGIQIPIMLFIISWFFYGKLPFRKVWWPFLVFGGFYIFHLIGMIHTEHIDLGITDLTEKLSLLIFPLFFATAKPIDFKFRRWALIAFTIGCSISVLFSFINAEIAYLETGNIGEFYMSNFSPLFHPSYMAMFINLSVAILLTAITTFKFSRLQYALMWIAILLLSLSLVFPTSKMGFIVFGLLILFFLVKWATQKALFKLNSALLLVVWLSTLAFIIYNPVAQNRIDSAVEFVGSEGQPQKSEQIESNAARMYAWEATIDEIKKHPLGVGTGDINIVLEDHFRESGLKELAEKELNPHNQYLQSAMAIGIPAMLWLVFSLVYPFGKIVKTRDWLYAFFLISIALNLMVESVLEKQTGIIFYAFFNCLFFFSSGLLNGKPKDSN